MNVTQAVRWAGALLTAALCMQPMAGHAQQAEPVAMSLRDEEIMDGLTVAAVGDIIQLFPAMTDPRIQEVARILTASDVAMGNFESSTIDLRTNDLPVNSPSHQIALHSLPEVAPDLKAMGFDLMNHANNHTLDFGIEGMRRTIRAFAAAGLEHAGSGDTSSLAGAPAYFETPEGRVAMIGVLAHDTSDNWPATDPNGQLPGKPGPNAIRVVPYYPVTATEFGQLQAMLAARAGDPRATFPSGMRGNTMPLEDDEIRLYGTDYKIADPSSGVIGYKSDPLDEARVLRNISDARANTDFLTVQIHASAQQRPETTSWLTDLAHKMIDAGADMIVGHGPQALRGIEIYRDRPIFYSLGAFWRELHAAAQPLPADVAEAIQNHPLLASNGGPSANDPSYRSVIAVSRFEENRLAEVLLYPIDLGATRNSAERGRPRLAEPQVAQQILKDLQMQSARYGTLIDIRKNVGVIRIR